MNPIVYLHIGTNKTGTSSIQSYCAQHRDRLLEDGVLYPLVGLEGSAHYDLSRWLGFSHSESEVADMGSPDLRKMAKALEKEIKRSKAGIVVLSSEMFVLNKPVEPVKDLLSGYDVRVVVYLRRHDHWWLSAYNQAVKTVAKPPWSRGLKRFINFNRRKNQKYGKYRFLVDRWAEVFGRENMIVRPFEAVQNPGGVVADFFRSLGLTQYAEETSRSEIHLNRSFSPQTLFLLDVVQRAEISEATRKLLKHHVLAKASPGNGEDLMQPSLRCDVIEENRADYEYIAKRYLGRSDGALFMEPEPSPDDPWEQPKMPGVIDVVTEFVGTLESSRPD